MSLCNLKHSPWAVLIAPVVVSRFIKKVDGHNATLYNFLHSTSNRVAITRMDLCIITPMWKLLLCHWTCSKLLQISSRCHLYVRAAMKLWNCSSSIFQGLKIFASLQVKSNLDSFGWCLPSLPTWSGKEKESIPDQKYPHSLGKLLAA